MVPVEIDLDGQSFDQLVDLAGVLFHERRRVMTEVPDLAGRRHGRENVRDQFANLGAVEGDILPPAKPVEAAIEFPFEPVDDARIEAGEPLLTEQFVEPVLPLDEKMQPPLAVLHVEGQQILHPARQVPLGLGLELERLAVGALVDDAFVDGPGVDDLRHHP